MYVLDTSAIKGISGEILRLTKENHDLRISTISVWELLSHLDEGTATNSFLRQRGNVLKCKLMSILDDPIAHHAKQIGIADRIDPSRFEDPEIITQILANLENCESLHDFEKSHVLLSNGEVKTCDNIAEMTRVVLNESEESYLSEFAQAAQELSSYLTANNLDSISDELLAQFILSDLKSSCVEHGLLEKPELVGKLGQSRFFYSGYWYARIRSALEKSGGKPECVSTDRNDFEDGLIISYLDINQPYTLVTNDKDTIAAFKSSKNAYHQKFEGFPLGARCISNDEFVVETTSK